MVSTRPLRKWLLQIGGSILFCPSLIMVSYFLRCKSNLNIFLLGLISFIVYWVFVGPSFWETIRSFWQAQRLATRYLGRGFRKIDVDIYRSENGKRQLRPLGLLRRSTALWSLELVTHELGYISETVTLVFPFGYKEGISSPSTDVLVAWVREQKKEPKVPHYCQEGHDETTRKRLLSARVLFLRAQGKGYSLRRMDPYATHAGWTWHSTIEEAKKQAEEEFGSSLCEWEVLPPEVIDFRDAFEWYRQKGAYENE